MKKALLIGINYRNTENELKGCINDVNNVKNLLLQKYGYLENNIQLLTDDTDVKPTRDNILTFLKKIIEESKNCTNIFIHYSGHGSNTVDLNRDENDGIDETIVPLDYMSNGMIVDDELRAIITPAECSAFIIFDSCHSGTCLDLRHTLKCVGSWYFYMAKNEKYSETKSRIVFLSGCLDEQTSADAIINNQAQGALTSSFLTVIKPNIRYQDLLNSIYQDISKNGFSQKPQLSFGKYVNSRNKIEL